ncbi:MAG: sigma-E processing peptidase SpoIIGA [Firmicutes bacterium]|nr:sigma-E processing peptidase SpoIIGA [Candidatus Fermentithermobacillaceae bacterium]
MTRYVYADVLFLVNFAANYLLLTATARLSRRRARRGRITLSALGGALYAAFALVPGLEPLYAWPVRLMAGALMVLISFPDARGAGVYLLFLSFYLCCTVAAGTAMALLSLVQSLRSYSLADRLWSPASWWTVLVGLLVAAAIPLLLALSSQKPGSPFLQVELEVDGKSVTLVGLLDTGNDLRDPLSGLPVIVVDLDSLKSILSGETLDFFSSNWESIGENLALDPMARRLRLIPYCGISGKRGVLPGFIPDKVLVSGRTGLRTPIDAVVGVSWQKLSPSGAYQALVHPDLV